MKVIDDSINVVNSKHASKREKDLFYSLCEKNHDVIKTKNFKNALLKSGLKVKLVNNLADAANELKLS